MTIKIVRTNEAEWKTALARGPFGQRRKELGGERLQCGLWELAPGKRSFPLHAHNVTEEALFAISGRAKVRTRDGEKSVEHALGAGDFVSFPVGCAHQLINEGDEPFIYVGISASLGFDIVDYPDSGKVACSIGKFPAARRMVFRAKDEVDYFDGEE
jgi:uncharacterized cupin superfamily protein